MFNRIFVLDIFYTHTQNKHFFLLTLFAGRDSQHLPLFFFF